jgi:hypothetical protein
VREQEIEQFPELEISGLLRACVVVAGHGSRAAADIVPQHSAAAGASVVVAVEVSEAAGAEVVDAGRTSC